MPSYKMNKTIAGYHMLMILSAVDHKFNVAEDMVIKDWLLQEFPFDVNLDRQMEFISRLLPHEWMTHFQHCMDDFFEDSTEAEQNNLIDFAIQLIKADNVITREENIYFNQLMNVWRPE